MTTLAAALKGIRVEISDTIRETGPQERVSADVAAFVEHDYADKGQPIEEIAGPARLFEIKEPMGVDNPMDGGDTTRQQWQIDVVFCYPRESKWFSVARGDIEKIRLALLNDHGGHGVSGVNSRWEATADYEGVVKEICSIIPGSVSAEVLVEGVGPMIEQARQIAKWAPNVAIKIPATAEGLEVTSTLARENIKVNLTLCFSLNQALLGALAGAAYISPFIGRLDDIGDDGMQLVRDIVGVYKHYQFPTEVIAASIRHPQHCVEAAKAGAHIATVPYNVLMQMIRHPLTDTGIERFLADWRRVSQSQEKK